MTSIFAFAEELRMQIQKEIDVFEINEFNRDSTFYETIMREGEGRMMAGLITLDDETEVVHSEMKKGGRVKVYVEKPDAIDGFHHMTCWLPDFEITEVYKLSDEELSYFMMLIRTNADQIIEASMQDL